MHHWIEFVATVGSLCDLASAAINLAATVIKYRRDRKPSVREAHDRPANLQGLLDQAAAAPPKTKICGDELGCDRHSPVARLAASNAAQEDPAVAPPRSIWVLRGYHVRDWP
jgi:hypothetical protein